MLQKNPMSSRLNKSQAITCLGLKNLGAAEAQVKIGQGRCGSGSGRRVHAPFVANGVNGGPKDFHKQKLINALAHITSQVNCPKHLQSTHTLIPVFSRKPMYSQRSILTRRYNRTNSCDSKFRSQSNSNVKNTYYGSYTKESQEKCIEMNQKSLFSQSKSTIDRTPANYTSNIVSNYAKSIDDLPNIITSFNPNPSEENRFKKRCDDISTVHLLPPHGSKASFKKTPRSCQPVSCKVITIDDHKVEHQKVTVKLDFSFKQIKEMLRGSKRSIYTVKENKDMPSREMSLSKCSIHLDSKEDLQDDPQAHSSEKSRNAIKSQKSNVDKCNSCLGSRREIETLSEHKSEQLIMLNVLLNKNRRLEDENRRLHCLLKAEKLENSALSEEIIALKASIDSLQSTFQATNLANLKSMNSLQADLDLSTRSLATLTSSLSSLTATLDTSSHALSLSNDVLACVCMMLDDDDDRRGIVDVEQMCVKLDAIDDAVDRRVRINDGDAGKCHILWEIRSVQQMLSQIVKMVGSKFDSFSSFA